MLVEAFELFLEFCEVLFGAFDEGFISVVASQQVIHAVSVYVGLGYCLIGFFEKFQSLGSVVWVVVAVGVVSVGGLDDEEQFVGSVIVFGVESRLVTVV